MGKLSVNEKVQVKALDYLGAAVFGLLTLGALAQTHISALLWAFLAIGFLRRGYNAD